MYEECNGAEKYYFYDSNGIISGIRYYDANGNMTMIYVVTNSQGDVIALYDRNGNAVVEYQYDAWGNIISTTNTTEGSSLDWNEVNPFRYRGYYYDADTGLYYLQSRYYDAETGRFLNSDVLLDTSDILGFNPFAYCLNNPILYVDYSGALCAIHAGGGGMPTNNTTKNTTNNTANALDKTIDVAGCFNRLTSHEFDEVVIDSISVEFSAGTGFGVAADLGIASAEAYFKGNILNLVCSTDEEKAGLFYSCESNVSVDVLIFEISRKESHKVNYFTGKETIKPDMSDISLKGEYSFGVSLYMFVGAEVYVRINIKEILDYILWGVK